MMREICQQGPVEVTGICSNPPLRLRHLLEAWDASSLSQVGDARTTALESVWVTGDLITHSPKRYLTGK
jgi:hypothetical protein